MEALSNILYGTSHSTLPNIDGAAVSNRQMAPLNLLLPGCPAFYPYARVLADLIVDIYSAARPA